MNENALWDIPALMASLDRSDDELFQALNRLLDETYALGALVHLSRHNVIDEPHTVAVAAGQVFLIDQKLSPEIMRAYKNCVATGTPEIQNGISIWALKDASDVRVLQRPVESLLTLPLFTDESGLFGCIQYFGSFRGAFDERDLLYAQKYLASIARTLYAQGVNPDYRPNRRLILSARGICRMFGSSDNRTVVLDHLDVDVFEREILVVWGSSGCGKSTLLNVLSGIDRPNAGEIYADGQELTKMSDDRLARYRREFTSYVFQQYNLIDDLSVYENVRLAQAISNSRMTAEEALEFVGMGARRNYYPAQLSGGEQQRAAIARAICKQSQVLFCDEPTGALDETVGKKVLCIFQRIVRELGGSIVLVTHNPQMTHIADRTITLRDGKVTRREFRPFPMRAEDVRW